MHALLMTVTFVAVLALVGCSEAPKGENVVGEKGEPRAAGARGREGREGREGRLRNSGHDAAGRVPTIIDGFVRG
jgi:hypothetical protein